MVVDEAAAVGRLLMLEDALEVVTVELDEAEVVKTAAEAETAALLVLVPVERV